MVASGQDRPARTLPVRAPHEVVPREREVQHEQVPREDEEDVRREEQRRDQTRRQEGLRARRVVRTFWFVVPLVSAEGRRRDHR